MYKLCMGKKGGGMRYLEVDSLAEAGLVLDALDVAPMYSFLVDENDQASDFVKVGEKDGVGIYKQIAQSA
jgi:hypothetical protein